VQFVRVPDGELEYAEYGHGACVVISAQWAFPHGTYQQLLTEGYRVIAITLRGYGRSMPETPDLGDGWYDRWADDVYQASRTLGVDRFVYTGSSHGAGVGWHLALSYPEVLRGFVSLAGAPKDRLSIRSPEEIARAIAARQSGPSPLRPDWPQRPLPRASTNELLADILKTVEVPTLLIAGAQDDIISLQDTLRALNAVRGAQAVIYQDGTHGISVDRAADIVSQFHLYTTGLA
jgi:pimeloyl-ACP methyl ester carboxylesterase